MGGVNTFKVYSRYLWARWDIYTINQKMLWNIPGVPNKHHLYSLKLHQSYNSEYDFIVRKDRRTDNFSRLQNKYQNMFTSISSNDHTLRWIWSAGEDMIKENENVFSASDVLFKYEKRIFSYTTCTCLIQFEGCLWAAALCHESVSIPYATQQSHHFSSFFPAINCCSLVPLCL